MSKSPALSVHDNETVPGSGAARRRGYPQLRARPAAAVALALALVVAGEASSRAATIEDSVNRDIDVPAGVTSVIPAGPPAQVLLQALAPSLLAGLVEPFKPEHVIYVDPKIAALPQIPMLTRTSAPGDIGMVAALKPGLVVDYGNASGRYAAADEKIQKELGVPAVLFAGDLGDAAHVARTLGGVLKTSRADEVAAVADEVLAKVKPLADLDDAARVPVYVARGVDGLTAARSGTSFDEPIRLAGGRNVVPSGSGTFARMNVEDVVALKPAFVVVSDRDALQSDLHEALAGSATFVLDAGEPYKVLTGPPSINRFTGVAALAAILHPDKVHIEPDEVTRLETRLFPIPPGLALPAPLQVVR